MVKLLTHAAYFAFILMMTAIVPQGALGMIHAKSNTILVLGFLGTWRYSWAAINFSRAIYYRRVVYPRRKATAFARFDARGAPCHAYFLVTSYMVDRETTIQCYRSLYLAAANARDGATIIASVVDPGSGPTEFFSYTWSISVSGGSPIGSTTSSELRFTPAERSCAAAVFLASRHLHRCRCWER